MLGRSIRAHSRRATAHTITANFRTTLPSGISSASVLSVSKPECTAESATPFSICCCSKRRSSTFKSQRFFNSPIVKRVCSNFFPSEARSVAENDKMSEHITSIEEPLMSSITKSGDLEAGFYDSAAAGGAISTDLKMRTGRTAGGESIDARFLVGSRKMSSDAGAQYPPIQDVREAVDGWPAQADFGELAFDNSEVAYQLVGTVSLFKSYLILSALKLPFIPENLEWLLSTSMRVLGHTITMALLKMSLFDLFTGGADLSATRAVAIKLDKVKVGTILDFAAESESGENTSIGDHEITFDANMALFKEAATAAKAVNTNCPPFIAVKVTAMSDPSLLQCVSALVRFSHSLFSSLASSRDPTSFLPETAPANVNAVPNSHIHLLSQSVPISTIRTALQSLFPALSEDVLQDVIRDLNRYTLENRHESSQSSIDYNDHHRQHPEDSISYLQWMDFFSPELISHLYALEIKSSSSSSSPLLPSPQSTAASTNDQRTFHRISARDDLPQFGGLGIDTAQALTECLRNNALDSSKLARWQAAERRIDELGQHAVDIGVRLLVDAEWTSIQCGIELLARRAMEAWNKGDVAAIYSTYQMYLKKSPGLLEYDYQHSLWREYKHGVKLVRGAYMARESKDAQDTGVDNPIRGTLQETAAAYDEAVEVVTQRLQNSELFCGTHNEESTRRAVDCAVRGVRTLCSRRDHGDSELKKDSNSIEGGFASPPSIAGAKDQTNGRGKFGTEALVTFAQLYGMCDHVTFGLQRYFERRCSGRLHAYKYVPYGQPEVVVPYLTRRAQENSAVFGNTGKEVSLMGRELKRRFLSTFGFKSGGS